MAISSTYGTLCETIADELGDRQDLLTPLSDSALTLSPIQNAVQQAIAMWERELFYFNDLYDNADSNSNGIQNITGFQTSSGQEFYGAATVPVAYALIANICKLDKVHILVSSNRYALIPRDWGYLEDISVNPVVLGQPTEYAYFNEMLRFYPIPDNAYPVTMSGTQRLTPLVSTTDANAWTQDGEALIRCTAKMILGMSVLYDDQLVKNMQAMIYGNGPIRGELYALKAETTRRGASGRFRPSHF